MFQSNLLKRKFLFNKKSKAQHVVELAMMMPLFIILFSYTFQLMVETYSKYKFSYIFTNSVRNVINSPEIYKDIANVADYDINKAVQEELENEITKTGSKIPFTSVLVEIINSDETTFFKGAYQLVADRIFFGQTGREYFYFTIPVNKTYTLPIVLNKTTHDVESYFNFYFKYYSEKYFEAEDTTEGGGTEGGDGTEGGTEGGGGGDGTEGGTEGGDGGDGGSTEGGDGGSTEGGDSGGSDSGVSGGLEDNSGGDSAIPASLEI